MPLYSIDRFEDGGTLAVWHITEAEEELKSIASVPEEEQEDIDLSPLEKRRIERYAVRALLNALFEEKVYLGYEEDNSPYLKNSHCGISISHSGNYACVFIHENESVGVDIEQLDRDFTAVEAKVLSKAEKSYLSDKYRQTQLGLIWCAKEAIYKLMCERGVDFSEQIEVEKFTPRDEEGELEATFTSQRGAKYELELDYKIFDGYALVWVTSDTM